MTEHRAANARLCAWLGIAPDVYHGPHGKSHDEQYVYPDLATREGFWLLRDALRAKGLRYWSGWADELLCTARVSCDGTVEQHHAITEPAALSAAAVALMEREVGNGN